MVKLVIVWFEVTLPGPKYSLILLFNASKLFKCHKEGQLLIDDVHDRKMGKWAITMFVYIAILNKRANSWLVTYAICYDGVLMKSLLY